MCIDYKNLNKATKKDHFPLLFMDQMLERLAGQQFYVNEGFDDAKMQVTQDYFKSKFTIKKTSSRER